MEGQRRIDRLRPVGDALVLAPVGGEDRAAAGRPGGGRSTRAGRATAGRPTAGRRSRAPPVSAPPAAAGRTSGRRTPHRAPPSAPASRAPTDGRAGASRPRQRGRTRACRSRGRRTTRNRSTRRSRDSSGGELRSRPSRASKPPATGHHTFVSPYGAHTPSSRNVSGRSAMIVATTSSTSRDLPMPGSPVTATIALRPPTGSRRGC